MKKASQSILFTYFRFLLQLPKRQIGGTKAFTEAINCHSNSVAFNRHCESAKCVKISNEEII